MGSPMAQSHMPLKGHTHGHQDLEAFYLLKECSYALCYY